LIIVNCIIICRCEVCASRQNLLAASADAVGQAIGFGLALIGIAVIREVLGTGMIAGFQIMPAAWPSWVIMVLPPGAFLTFGLLLALVNWIDATRSNKKG
jgi:electron transport complex protein RnfE